MKLKNINGKYLAIAALAGAILLLCGAIFGAFGGLFSGKPDGSRQITASAASGEVFSFDSVRFEATVNGDKTLDITETLVAVWNVSGKSSLIRDIQRQSKTTRVVNGKKVKGKNYFAKISDISATLDGGECDWHILPKSDDFYDANFFSIEMKQPDGSYLLTQKAYTFVLKYKYDMGDDRLSAFDDLTFDIYGYAMNYTDKFSAKITFPEGTQLSYDNTTMRSAMYREWTPIEEYEKFDIAGNVIEIEALRRGGQNGLTLQVILPKGTFTGGITVFWYYWVFIVLAVAAVMGIIILVIKNVPVKPVEPVEFYPPEGVSVMRFSAIWHKAAKSKDAAALILKWADMGLITIEKEGYSDLVLRLNKPADNTEKVFEEEFSMENLTSGERKYFDSAAEKQYFKTLFSGIGGSDGVFSTKAFKFSGESNQRQLYNATNSLVESVSQEPVIKPVKKARKLIPFMGLIPMALVMVYNCIIGSTFLPLLFLIFMAAGTFAGVSGIKEDGSLMTPLIFIFPVAFFAMPYFVFIWQIAMPLYDYARLIYIAPAIYAVSMFVLPFILGRRTEEANKLYGRIRGFRHFLLTAELPRIQLMFDENPDYFSDILPWCLIMNISDKVQKRFAALKTINMPKVIEDNIDVRFVSRCIAYSSFLGMPRSSGSGGSFGGGGGGHGGSFGGGGGGGGSRSR